LCPAEPRFKEQAVREQAVRAARAGDACLTGVAAQYVSGHEAARCAKTA
jgi:hypothetical protein